jgi:hypothetical protein
MGGEKRNLVVSEVRGWTRHLLAYPGGFASLPLTPFQMHRDVQDGSSGSLSKKPKEDTTVPAPACEPESSTTVVNGRTLRHRDREAVPPRMPRVQKPRSLPKWVTAGGRVEKGLNLTDVKLPVSEAEQQPDEGAALFDSRLTVRRASVPSRDMINFDLMCTLHSFRRCMRTWEAKQRMCLSIA